MKFEYPIFLVGFLFLAIPIIIHLFNFRRYKILYFSSLRFLKQIDEETKSTQKLKHLLVLAARILAFSALILAFAQPYIPAKTDSQSGYPVLAIYLDNSFSMTLKGTEGELISEAREQAKRLVNQVDVTTRILLVTNEMSGIEERILTKAEALDRIDKIEPSAIERKTGEVVQWMRETLDNTASQSEKLGTKQIVLLSDFQSKTSDLSALKSDSLSFYFAAQFKPQQASNLTIDSIWFTDPNFKIGVNNELSVRIYNSSDEAVENIPLQLDVNGSKRDVFIEAAPNSFATTVFNYSDSKPGFKKGVLRIADKQVHFDDDFYFSYAVKDRTNILVLDGEDAVSNIQRVYSLDAFYEVNSVSETSFTSERLQGKDVLVLNGLNSISTGAANLIVSFANEGGTVVIFPGSKIDFSSYNALLKQLNMPLLQATLSEGTRVKSIQQNDVFFKSVFEKKPENLNLPLQSRVYKTTNQSATNAVSLIGLQNGMSLFSRSNSTQSVYLFASSLKSDFGNFTSNALFSTLVLRMAEMSQRSIPLYLTLGTESKFPVFAAKSTENPVRLKSDRTEIIPQTDRKNQLLFISLSNLPKNQTLDAEIYEIEQDGNSLGTVAMNYNRNESDITMLKQTEIEDKLGQQNIKNVSFKSIDKGQSLIQIELDKPFQYWRFCLLMALFFFLTEMLILKFMNK